jgi:hypothetical protein
LAQRRLFVRFSQEKKCRQQALNKRPPFSTIAFARRTAWKCAADNEPTTVLEQNLRDLLQVQQAVS